MSTTATQRSFARKFLISVVRNTSFFVAATFCPIVTLAWWRAWILVAVMALVNVVMALAVFRGRDELFDERLKPLVQPDQLPADKVLIMLFLPSYFATIALASLDGFKMHLLSGPPVWLSCAGFVL